MCQILKKKKNAKSLHPIEQVRKSMPRGKRKLKNSFPEKSADSLSHLINFGGPNGLIIASKNAGIRSSAVLDLIGLN